MFTINNKLPEYKCSNVSTYLLITLTETFKLLYMKIEFKV